MENLWSFHSIYELQFFNCPSCNYKNKSKQEFVDHACKVHPESINNLMNIKDISDLVCPWNEIEIKDEIIELVDDNDDSNESEINISDTTDYHENQSLVTTPNKNKHPEPERQFAERSEVANVSVIYENKGNACEKCGKVFKSNYKLKEHISVSEILSCTDELDFKCTRCPATFNSLKRLQIHIHFLHEKTGKNEECETCGITFKNNTNKAMLHYEEVHLGIKKEKVPEKEEECKICGKK